MLEAYRAHVIERAQQNIPAKPLSASQVAELIELLKNPPAGESEFLLDLLSTRGSNQKSARCWSKRHYCSNGRI